MWKHNWLNNINMYRIISFHFLSTMWLGDQGAHVRERLTANRSDLTLQGGPNQHDTHKSRRTTRINHSPPRLELQDRPTIIWSAELNVRPPKVNNASPFLRDYLTTPGVGCGFLYFRIKAVLGLPVSTTSYSRHAISTVQTWSAGPTTVRSSIDTDGARHQEPCPAATPISH